jgi:AcrR family transcriptional regulator
MNIKSAEPAPSRSAKVQRAVLEVTADLLAEGGLPAANVDEISRRSKVSKATIYKHWPNRVAVAIDAFAQHMTETVPISESGSAIEDLTEQVRRVGAFYSTPAGAVFAQLLAATTADPAAGDRLRQRFLADRRRATTALWQDGVQRGELRADIDPDIAIDVLFGPIAYRLLSGHAELDEHQLTALADAAIHGLKNPIVSDYVQASRPSAVTNRSQTDRT